MSSEVIKFLQSRRSVVAKKMLPTAPTEDQLSNIIRCGLRVPDHSNVQPWRIIVLKDDARRRFAEKIVLPAAEANAEKKQEALTDTLREMELSRLLRGGLVIAVLSKPVIPHKVPVWEQQLSAGAVCSHLLMAAQSLNFAAQWITEWLAYEPTIIEALGGNPEHDLIAGFIHIGGKTEAPGERSRPLESEIVSYWQ